MIFLQLFYEFFKTGLFAVGGGMATLPFLYAISDKHPAWFSYGELADMVAVSESTPGPIGVNMATYVGFKTAGVGGAVTATMGLILPSIIVILIIALFLKAFKDSKYVRSAFYTLRPTSTALIAAAGIGFVGVVLVRMDLFRQTGAWQDLILWKGVILAAILLFVSNWKKTKKLHPIVWIAASAVIGIIFRFAGV